MNRTRRNSIRYGGLSALALGAGALPGASILRSAKAADYKALVCVFLRGGNDGNDCLIPIDSRYDDYASVRKNLALAKSSIVPLGGSQSDGRFGMHPGLAPLVPMYDSGRMAWVANIGPLLAPTAIEAARAGRNLPPFLMSHADQVLAQQGWLYGDERSGWGGRAIEALPPELSGNLANLSLSPEAQWLTGRRIGPRFGRANGWTQYWGPVDLKQPSSDGFRALQAMSSPTFTEEIEDAYAKTLRDAVADSALLISSLGAAPTFANDFPNTEIGGMMREVAQFIAVRNAIGAVRQTILVDWGQLDTHASQRGTTLKAQDRHMAELGAALAAFDAAMRSLAVSEAVTTFIMSDFGRTFQPAGDSGSDHAWGNHWLVFGDAVKGGRVLGKFPSLTLGGPDDMDSKQRGRWLPTTATDQFAATLVNWLGVPDSRLLEVLPNLAAFPQKRLDFL